MAKEKAEVITIKIRKTPKQCYDDKFFYEVVSPDLAGFSVIVYDQWTVAELLELVKIFKCKNLSNVGKNHVN